MVFVTPFREAFREYKIQSGAIDEAVLKDENHNESESMDDLS